MEYEELKKLIERVKTMQQSETIFLAYRSKKLTYENYTILDVVNASKLIEGLFIRLGDFETDIEEAIMLFEEFEFKSREEFINSTLLPQVVGDYLYEYGTVLADAHEFHEHMIEEKEYKNYTPEQFKLMFAQLKEDERVRFTDDNYEFPYDPDTDDEEILDWWIEECEAALRNQLYPNDLAKIELNDWEKDWEQMTLREGEYMCSECGKKIKCASTTHLEENRILCETCMDKAAVIESIKTELFF